MILKTPFFIWNDSPRIDSDINVINITPAWITWDPGPAGTKKSTWYNNLYNLNKLYKLNIKIILFYF